MERSYETLQESLAGLKLQFNSPITLRVLEMDFEKYFKIDGKWNENDLKKYLIGFIDKFLTVIQLDNISKETMRIEDLIKDIRKEKYIKFNVFENGNYEEANTLLKDIYTKWNNVQLRKELCSDHIVLIKKAIIHLTSLKKVVSAFIQENKIYYKESKIHFIMFKNLADLKRFIEGVTVNIDSYIEVLKGQINELSAYIDNTLSARINMLMRADSSLRLLSKYAEWDYSNRCGNTSPREYGGGVSEFNVQPV